MKRILVVLNTVFAMSAANTYAEPVLTPANLHDGIAAKAEDSQKGVIMVLSGRGDVAADAAFLLVSQLKENPGYAPMLLIADQGKLQGYMKTLALSDKALPAVVFFDKSGKELNRVIAAHPAAGGQHRLMTAAIR